jgi:raffinose/stachyose/melibiose transport system permease protein
LDHHIYIDAGRPPLSQADDALMKNSPRLANLITFTLALIWLLPLLVLLSTAVRPQGDLIQRGILSVPSSLRFSNFSHAWTIGNLGHAFFNSFLVTLVKVPLGLLVSSLAAYAFTKLTFRGSSVLLFTVLLGLGVPPHVTLLPVIHLLHKLHLSNSLWGLIPPYIAFGLPLQVFVFRAHFRGIPNELGEAARLDGASELRIFWQVVLPLSKPVLLTLAIIDAVGTWNELLIALVVLSSEKSRTVALDLLSFQGQFGTHYTEMTAAILIAILPLLAFYLFCQRYMVSGMTAGALKE